MKPSPNDWAIGLTFLLAALFIVWRDGKPWYRLARLALHRLWSNTVGAWFARRRMVGRFTERRYRRIRVGEPDMHSPGIMASRRDINTGVWS